MAQIKTKLDARNGLDLHVDHVRYNEKLCLVLIDLLDQDNNESTQPQRYLGTPTVTYVEALV